MYFLKKIAKFQQLFSTFDLKIDCFGKAPWSPIILRSFTKYVIYEHSRTWSPKSMKNDLRSLMIVIWSEMIGDHDQITLTLVCTLLCGGFKVWFWWMNLGWICSKFDLSSSKQFKAHYIWVGYKFTTLVSCHFKNKKTTQN